MKLAPIAQALTLVLLACTAYLAWQAQQEAASANAKFERLTRQAEMSLKVADQLQEGLVPGLTTPMQMPGATTTPKTPTPAPTPEVKAQPTVAVTAPNPTETPTSSAVASATTTPATPLDEVKATLPPLPKPLPNPPDASPSKVATSSKGSAGTPAPTVAPSPDAPLPLTPLQRRVKDSPSMGKVKEVVTDQGFVSLDFGTSKGAQKGMKFDLRRDSAVVGRVSITDTDVGESVADLDPKSVPAGVTVQPGDEVISVILDR